jgi:hypothetical protein
MAVTGRIFALKLGGEEERLCQTFGIGNIGGPERRKIDRHTPDWFEMAHFGGIGDGIMAFRRVAFDVWPGFDERLGRGVLIQGGEEHHAFFSLIDRGYSIVYTPAAVVRHNCPQTLGELRARHLRDLTAASAYITLLFFEEGRYRRRVLKYINEALQYTPRVWRDSKPNSIQRIVPRWRTVVAYLYGPLVYLRAVTAKARAVSWRRTVSPEIDDADIHIGVKTTDRKFPVA